jgi:hypothetical protein
VSPAAALWRWHEVLVAKEMEQSQFLFLVIPRLPGVGTYEITASAFRVAELFPSVVHDWECISLNTVDSIPLR